MSKGAMMTIADFVAANPNADPKDLLPVVLAETERIKEAQASREHEYKIANEVELDDNLNPKPKTLAQLFRTARMYVDSGLVPDTYLKAKNGDANPVPGVAIGIQASHRCGVDTLTFLQSSFIHKGKIGIESKLAIAMLIKSGKIDGRPKYEIEKNERGEVVKCTCKVTDTETGEEKSQTVDWGMVEAEGWHLSNGSQKSKWITLRELMFQYRSGIFVARVHYPDVLLGMHTTEELEDMARAGGDTGGTATTATGLEELSEQLGAAPAPKATAKPRGRRSAGAVQHEEQTIDSAGETAEPVKTSVENARGDTDNPKPKTPTAKSATTTAGIQSRQPAAPAGPVGTLPAAAAAPTPAPSSQPPKKSTAMSPEGLKSYMKIKFEDDWTVFDLDRIIEVAIKQNNPQAYCDVILSRKNPNWSNFMVAEQADETTDENLTEDPDPAESQDSSAAGGDTSEGQMAPECIMNPLPRPRAFVLPGTHIERTVMGYRQAKRIRDLMRTEIRNHPGLTNEEAAYLLDLGERRAWYLENGHKFEELPKETQIPAE